MLFSLGVLLASLFSTPFLIRYARLRQLHDEPGERRSHSGVIPRAGGAAAVIVLMLAIVLRHSQYHWALSLLPPLLAMAWIGWRDDHQSQSVKLRLIVQFLCAIWLLVCFDFHTWALALVGLPTAWFGLVPVLVLVAMLTLVWLVNLYNFMDGSHGLAASEAIFCGLGSYLILSEFAPAAASFGLLMALVMLGFLPWNFPHPKIFMGDVASSVLGLGVGIMALMAGAEYWFVPLSLSALFVIDATYTLADRVCRGEVWHQAHTDHVYQRLIRSGWSHHKVWSLYMSINLVFILPMAKWAASGHGSALLVLATLATILSMSWLLAMRYLRAQ